MYWIISLQIQSLIYILFWHWHGRLYSQSRSPSWSSSNNSYIGWVRSIHTTGLSQASQSYHGLSLLLSRLYCVPILDILPVSLRTVLSTISHAHANLVKCYGPTRDELYVGMTSLVTALDVMTDIMSVSFKITKSPSLELMIAIHSCQHTDSCSSKIANSQEAKDHPCMLLVFIACDDHICYYKSG